MIIVLGVLTALAVDNWRESQEAQVLQSNYLSRLANDLNRDLDDLGAATWAAMAHGTGVHDSAGSFERSAGVRYPNND